MSQKISKEKLPENEYRGKLRDASDFGENVFAITIAPDGGETLHVGPFQFERPIGLYVGQQVAVWVSAERTEKGIFRARMRWTNPMPGVRGGKSRKTAKGTPRKKAASQKPERTRERPQKGETRKRRKAMLRDMLGSGADAQHAVNDVCFALNLRPHQVPGMLGLEGKAVTRPLTTAEVVALRDVKYPPRVAVAPVVAEPASVEDVGETKEAAMVAEPEDAPSTAADYVAAAAALQAEFEALEASSAAAEEE